MQRYGYFGLDGKEIKDTVLMALDASSHQFCFAADAAAQQQANTAARICALRQARQPREQRHRASMFHVIIGQNTMLKAC